VLAEAPVGGGGGNGVASLSWRGDGQFLAVRAFPTSKSRLHVCPYKTDTFFYLS
jgi:hypothetical protein